MNSHLPWDVPPAGADRGTTLPAADNLPGRRLIAVMLLAVAAMDLTRCSLVLARAHPPATAPELVAAGLAAAALSLWTARGCQSGRRWSAWAALLIGAASAPQAAASSFHDAYTIPDTTAAALGILLTIAVLATAGRTGRPGQKTHSWCAMDRGSASMTAGPRAEPHARSCAVPAGGAAPSASTAVARQRFGHRRADRRDHR
jgi:hypothetical protein